MIESVIIFEGEVTNYETEIIEARVVLRTGGDFELDIHESEFPIPRGELKGGEIFYIRASGDIELPRPWTQEEIDAAKKRAKELHEILFEGASEDNLWNSPSETGATAEAAPSGGRSSPDSD